MAEVNLSTENYQIDSTADSIVVQNVIETIAGGRSLNCTGFADSVVTAGHVIIKKANGDYAPMPVASGGTAYDTLPEGAAIVGILVSSVRADRALAGIMVRGTVNEVACKYAPTSAIKTALPLIRFTQD